jgi:SAM-dependent methyltransferase
VTKILVPAPRRQPIESQGPRIVPPRRKRKGRRPRFTAATADRYELYQLAVQSPEVDVEFLSEVYREVRGRKALHLREDFCGTALLSCEWARQSPRHTAEGFDLDPEPLAWGRERNLRPLGRAARRVLLRQADARSDGRPADVRCAQNFSYWVFRERRQMLRYFKLARKSLAPGGIFVLDLFGGDEGTAVMTEEREIDEGFTYVWDQARFLPGNGEYWCKIHFHFKDGSKLLDAFRYHWRHWTMSELKDVLADAGFGEVHSWFEAGDDEGDGIGEFVRDEEGKTSEDCAGWVGYLVAWD